MLADFPKIDYSKLSKYETEDNTTGAQTVACSGDSCEIIQKQVLWQKILKQNVQSVMLYILLNII